VCVCMCVCLCLRVCVFISNSSLCGRYVIDGFRGSVELEVAEGGLEGIACSLESEGHHALVAATKAVRFV